MLNVEFKVNGNPIGFLNILNKTRELNPGFEEGLDIYEYVHATDKGVKGGTVSHKRTDGFEKLVTICLTEVSNEILDNK